MNCLKRFVGHLIDQRRAFYRNKFEDSLLTPKQMHAYLKKEQETFVRPFQNIPFEQRPEERRRYWAKIWGDSPDGACYEEWPEWNEIVELGRTQLSNEKAISPMQLHHMLTQYPSKRGGLDGWSVKELKALPKEALSAWAYMYRKTQQEFQWPVALTVVGYALWPKSEEAERPIALTSLWYRLLIKSRLHLLEAWLQKVAALCPWDRAVAGSTVFCSSMARMLRAEILPHAKLYQASVLVDLKHCYDRMNIQLLIRAALKRKYPPGLLALAVPVHCGARVLMAENMHSQCVQPVRGILAGCSLSVSLAKLYLWDMMEALQLSPGLVASDTCFDDLSFDLVDYNPDRLALRALALYEDLAGRVAELELQISVKMSGFLVSHVAVAQPLKTLLQAARTKRGFEYPQVCTALKDLGAQTTLARCRRVGVQKARLGKGRGKRKQLVKGNIMPTATWGHQAAGLAKTMVRSFRAQLAQKALFRKKLGCLQTAYRLFMNKEADPQFALPIRQVVSWCQLLRQTRPSALELVGRAWKIQAAKIQHCRVHWCYARGPMAACMCVLKDLGWGFSELFCWVDPGNQAWTFSLDEPMTVRRLLEKLEWCCERNLWREAVRHQGGVDLGGGVDLVVAHKHLRYLLKQNRLHEHNLLLHVLQGTLPTSHNGIEEACSACGSLDASLKHKLWKCPAVSARLGPIPEVWDMSLDEEGLQSLWLRGLVPACLTALPDEALRREAPFDVQATLGGPLPGYEQTVPRAEAHAIKMLFQYTTGAAEFCSDSQLCVRRLKKVRKQTYETLERLNNPSTWLQVKLLRQDRPAFRAAWIRSHQQPEYAEELWQHHANHEADKVAGDVAAQLAKHWCLKDRVTLLTTVDGRCRKVQEALIARYRFWHESLPKQAMRKQGPKPPTRVQLVEHASVTHPAHSFRLNTKGSSRQAECVRCRLQVKSSWRRSRLQACLKVPCSGGYQFAVLGVHRTHEPYVDGGRLRCRRCSVRQTVHSFACCNKFQKVCRG